MYSNPHKETKVRKYNQSCTFTELLKIPWCLGSHFSNFIFPFLLILFAMSYYVREIVNSLYYSILKKVELFLYMTTRDFNFCISLINLASNIQILNNCIQHVGLIAQMWRHLPNIHRSVPGDSQFDLKTYQASIIT